MIVLLKLCIVEVYCNIVFPQRVKPHPGIQSCVNSSGKLYLASPRNTVLLIPSAVFIIIYGSTVAQKVQI